MKFENFSTAVLKDLNISFSKKKIGQILSAHLMAHRIVRKYEVLYYKTPDINEVEQAVMTFLLENKYCKPTNVTEDTYIVINNKAVKEKINAIIQSRN